MRAEIRIWLRCVVVSLGAALCLPLLGSLIACLFTRSTDGFGNRFLMLSVVIVGPIFSSLLLTLRSVARSRRIVLQTLLDVLSIVLIVGVIAYYGTRLLERSFTFVCLSLTIYGVLFVFFENKEVSVAKDLSEKAIWRRICVRIGVGVLIAAVVGAFGGWAVSFITLDPPALSVMIRNGIVFTVCVGLPGLSPKWFVKPTALVGERRYGALLTTGVANLNPLKVASVVGRYVLRVGVIVGVIQLVVLSGFACVMMEDKSMAVFSAIFGNMLYVAGFADAYSKWRKENSD